MVNSIQLTKTKQQWHLQLRRQQQRQQRDNQIKSFAAVILC